MLSFEVHHTFPYSRKYFLIFFIYIYVGTFYALVFSGHIQPYVIIYHTEETLHNHICLLWSSLNPSSLFHTEFKQTRAWKFLTRCQTLPEEVSEDKGWPLLGDD